MSLNDESPPSNDEPVSDEPTEEPERFYGPPHDLSLYRKRKHPRQDDIILIHNQAVPMDTPEDEARTFAESNALEIKPEGEIVSSQVMYTEDHDEANEYVMVVLVARPAEPAPEEGGQ